MLHPLVHRQDGEIAGAGQAPVAEQGRQRPQDPRGPVAHHPDPVDEIGPRQVAGSPWGTLRTCASAGHRPLRLTTIGFF